MLHGSRKLKHIDLSKPAPTPKGNAVPVLGRNKELLNRRNRKIAIRYYYHNALKNRPISKTLEILIYEFDLDSYTISKILKREADSIIEMKKNKVTIVTLKKEFDLPTW